MKGRKPTARSLKAMESGHVPVSRGMPVYDPAPPAHLDQLAREEWDRLIEALNEVGSLAATDLSLLEGVCCAYSRWRRAEAAVGKLPELHYTDARGVPHVHPLVTEARKALEVLSRLATAFGMSPASRRGVEPVPDPPGDDDPLEELLG